MYCQNCGAENRKNAKFCMNCGQLILKEQKKKKSLFIVCLSVLLVVLSSIAVIGFLNKKELASISDPMYTLGDNSLLIVWQIDNLSDDYITVEVEPAIVYNANGEKINFSYENYITAFPKEIPPHSHGYAYCFALQLANFRFTRVRLNDKAGRTWEHCRFCNQKCN